MVPEAPLEQTDSGLVAKGDGWFVLNARDSRWYHAEGRTAICDFEGDVDFKQVGINVSVLRPGQPMAMYHWEADQEDVLVLSGEALLIVEREERSLRAWDFVHCPPGTNHVIVGAGDGPCVVVAVGARDKSVDNPEWGGYPVDETARRHGASAEQETTEPKEAYAGLTRRQTTRYRPEWLGQD
ncbi:MAG: cupin domain-containing protein [Gaiellaceae bacterium]